MKHTGPERRKFRRVMTAWSAFIYVAIVLMVGVAVWQLQQRSAQDLEIIAVQTCESVNVGRSATNRQSLLLRESSMLAADRADSSAKAALTQEERLQATEAAASYRTLAKTYVEVRLADCRYPPIR